MHQLQGRQSILQLEGAKTFFLGGGLNMLKNKSRVIFGMICSTFWKLLRGGLNPIAPLLWSLVNWIKKRIFKTIGLALS